MWPRLPVIVVVIATVVLGRATPDISLVKSWMLEQIKDHLARMDDCIHRALLLNELTDQLKDADEKLAAGDAASLVLHGHNTMKKASVFLHRIHNAIDIFEKDEARFQAVMDATARRIYEALRHHEDQLLQADLAADSLWDMLLDEGVVIDDDVEREATYHKKLVEEFADASEYWVDQDRKGETLAPTITKKVDGRYPGQLRSKLRNDQVGVYDLWRNKFGRDNLHLLLSIEELESALAVLLNLEDLLLHDADDLDDVEFNVDGDDLYNIEYSVVVDDHTHFQILNRTE